MAHLHQLEFKDFITLQRGFDLPSKKRVVGQYPVVASTSVNGHHNQYKVESPGVVTGRSGSLGEVLYLDKPFWPLNTTLWVKDFKGNLPRYVYYFLKTIDLKHFNSGAGVPTLDRNDLDGLQITVHDLETQRKIASILSTYDDLIENNTRRIEILEEMARAIYREWFVHLRFPGHEKVRMVDSELGQIPEGWEVHHLGEIAEQVRRNVKPEQYPLDIPYVGLEHIPRESIALLEWDNLEDVQSSKLSFGKGEILFGKIRPYFHKVAVAPVAGLCSSDAIVISPKAAEHFAIVLCTVSSKNFVDHATQTSQGTKMPRANWSVLVEYPVAVPPQPLLQEFNQLVEDIVAQIHNMIFRNHNLRRTRDLLLPKLVSGEIDVEKVNIDSDELVDESE